jgi:hypothetical protein
MPVLEHISSAVNATLLVGANLTATGLYSQPPRYGRYGYPPGQGNAIYLRDFAEQIKPNDTQRTTLIVAGCYVAAIALLWHLPYLNAISKCSPSYH